MKTVNFGLATQYANDASSPGVDINKNGKIVEVHHLPSFNQVSLHVGRMQNGNMALYESSKQNSIGNGNHPDVSIDSNDTFVVIHSGEGSNLYASVGRIINEYSWTWLLRDSYFDRGFRPKVAINDSGYVVEIHKSQNNDGLWYNLGKLQNGTISWLTGDSHGRNYDTGGSPDVSINNQQFVIEVHTYKADSSDNRLYYRVGIVNGERVDWKQAHPVGVFGSTPSIALSDDNQVLLVYEGTGHQLYSKNGTLDTSRFSVEWGSSKPFDTGAWPSVGMEGNFAVQVHNSESLTQHTLWGTACLNIERAKWMEYLLKSDQNFAQKRLWEIVIPGTHDSATCDVGISRVPEACRDFKFDIPFIGEAVRPWSIAQSRTIFDQLNEGIRFLDLRVYYAGANFYAYHDVIGETFSSIFSQILRFLSLSNKEIVVLQFGGWCQFDTDPDPTHQAFIKLITIWFDKLFGKWLYTGTIDYLLSTCVEELTKDGSKVIIWYNSDKYAPTQPGFFTSLNMQGKYTQTTDLTEMKNTQLKQLLSDHGRPDKLFELFWTLTPSTELIEHNLLESLHWLANNANPYLSKFIDDLHTNYPKDEIQANVIISDFYQDSRVVDIAVSLNQN